MQDLTVIGVESGALIVAGDDGERFRLVVDEVLQSRLRQAVSSADGAKKVSPREIQTHIRAGLSAFEVAELTGASVEYVERFEGPVVAEREFIVDSARRVPVQPTSPADPLGEEPLTTFGEALEERLESLDAKDVRWSSWKDETGWTVKLTFSSREIEHDARWQFDPKRHVLTPLNNEATTLSRHGELSEGLIPRLRAVAPVEPGDARFDSGAFTPLDAPAAAVPAPTSPAPDATPAPAPATTTSSTGDTVPAVAPITIGGSRAKEQRPYDAFAVNRAPEADTADHNQTADLLEALRRRRGERESAGFGSVGTDEAAEVAEAPAVDPVHPAFGGPRAAEDVAAPAAEPAAEVADTPLDGLDEAFGELARESRDEPPAAPAPAAAAPAAAPAPARAGGAKRQRAAMPSWDEIVFGARSEDDPA